MTYIILSSQISLAQTFGLNGNRFHVSVNSGVTFSTLSFTKIKVTTYVPKTGLAVKKASLLDAPFEVGLSCALSNQVIGEFRFGMFNNYESVSEIWPSGTSRTFRHEFEVRQFTLGFQLNGKKFYAPATRLYAEIEYTHSLYFLNSVGFQLTKPYNTGGISVGIYRNFFIGKNYYVMPFVGVKLGVQLFSFMPGNFTHVNSSVEIKEDLTKSLLRIGDFQSRLVHLRFGIKFNLPF